MAEVHDQICKICDGDKDVLDGICLKCEDSWYDEIKKIDETSEMLERAGLEAQKKKLTG